MPPKKQAPSVTTEMTVDGPNLSQLMPNTLPIGGPAATIEVYGTGFDNTCVVYADTIPRNTFFLDDGHLQYTARPDLQTGAQTVTITVESGPGTISNGLPFTYTGPTGPPAGASIGFWTCDCGLSISASQPLPAPPTCICARTMYPISDKAPKTLYDVVWVDQQDQRNR